MKTLTLKEVQSEKLQKRLLKATRDAIIEYSTPEFGNARAEVSLSEVITCRVLEALEEQFPKYPKYACQKCGRRIGYLGRFLNWLFRFCLACKIDGEKKC